MNIASWLHRAGLNDGRLAAVAVGRSGVFDYATLAARASGLASGMRSKWGLAPGDRVAIVSENHPCYLEALFGVWWAGLIAVPIDARLHPAEVAWILEHSGAEAIIASAERTNALAGIASPSTAATFETPEYGQMARGDGIEVAHREASDGAWLFYTSGTTGRPKGALLSHRNLMLTAVAHVAEVDPTTAGDTLIHSAPMSHASGMLGLSQVCRAGLNVIPEAMSFDPDETLDLVRFWRRASVFVAPTMVRRLVEVPQDVDRSAIRSIVWGGAPMLVADAIRALDRFGPCLAQVYGQGESPMTITSLSKAAVADRDHPEWTARLASAGTPRGVVEVLVADEQDRPVPTGDLGEVLVRGDTVMLGYWNDPTATAATLRGGWLHTGDVGFIDASGNLTLKDRSKDLIISGGLNIYPREVEEVLAATPGVTEVSVIGRPDDEWGEVVVAYISGTADAAELDRACLAQIARFKRPRDYVFVDSLPKNNAGKILKSKLRKIDQQQCGAASPSSPGAS